MNGIEVIKARNVCEALQVGVAVLGERGLTEITRAGPARVSAVPVITVTENPMQRVLFSAVRDANPFFHLIEAVWMLSGRQDVAPLAVYVARFREYAEQDGNVHGAYGARWRWWFGYDQLASIVHRLSVDPGTRQAVLTMWDPAAEHVVEQNTEIGPIGDRGDGSTIVTGGNDLRGDWRDRPCNTQAYFRVRGVLDAAPVLDLTVLCRSNDAVWGAHGANAVHFSYLQEFVANSIGVPVGRLYQVSNNYHAYTDMLTRMDRRREELIRAGKASAARLLDDRYDNLDPLTTSRLDSPQAFDEQSKWFWTLHGALVREGVQSMHGHALGLSSTLLRDALWAAWAHRLWRDGDVEGALATLDEMPSSDWRLACKEWIQRRLPSWEVNR